MLKTPKVLSVVGYANNGKTTFLEKLIPELRSLGVSVAVIKHHGHSGESSQQEKDTGRLRTAGAAPVGLVQGGTLKLEYTFGQQPEPEELAKLLPEVDLLITEGFKRAHNPKLEVWRHADQLAPACAGDPYLIALITCHESDLELPHFGLDEHAKVARFIVEYFQL